MLLPGLFGSSYGYRHVMELLDSAGYHAIGIEPLGMGTSARPEDADYSLAAQADRVAAVLDTLAIRQAVLVGHSLGSSIALRVAYKNPEVVRGIVSLEGGAAESAATAGFRRWMRFAPLLRLFDGRQMLRRTIYSAMKRVSFDDSWVNGAIVAAYTTGPANDYKGTLKAYQSMARAKEPELLRDHLREISCSVVLLVGQAEHQSGPSADELALLRERLPSFTVDTIARSGYFIQEEQPAAVVSAVSGIGAESCSPGTALREQSLRDMY